MKTIIKIFGTAILLVLLSASSFAQNFNYASSDASATIVAPITIEHYVDLEFGDIAVSAVDDGTVVLEPTGPGEPIRTESGGCTLPLMGNHGNPRAASFLVSGLDTYTYEITIEPAEITLTHESVGTETMLVNTFTSTPSGTGVLMGGSEWLYVGATIEVNAGQLPGHYLSETDAFLVTVNYN
jgi:hypothetical protein